MSKIVLYSAAGEKKGSVDLNVTIFGAKVNPGLMHRAVIRRLANARTPIAHVQTRGEVAATTKKLFRQKGTGNARRGAKSTGLLRGGAAAHGPRNTVNYSKNMPKKERRAALFSSLSSKANDSELFALEGVLMKEPSTKNFSLLLAKLPEAKKYLFVLPDKDFVFERSASNLPRVETILASYLNPYDVLHADRVCFVGDSLKKIEDTFLSKK